MTDEQNSAEALDGNVVGDDRIASVVIRRHAFIQNLRRGHYELGVEARHEHLLVAAAFDELSAAI